jgi:hypothetical protein
VRYCGYFLIGLLGLCFVGPLLSRRLQDLGFKGPSSLEAMASTFAGLLVASPSVAVGLAVEILASGLFIAAMVVSVVALIRSTRSHTT